MTAWTNLRLEECIAKELSEYRDSLQVQVNSRPGSYPEYLSKGRISLGTCICYLLDCKERHSERARRFRRRKEASASSRKAGQPASDTPREPAGTV